MNDGPSSELLSGNAVMLFSWETVPVFCRLHDERSGVGGASSGMGVTHQASVPRERLREANRRPMVESDIMQELAILLAGRVAETMVLGEPSIGAGGSMASDLARAILTARTIEQACGMGADGLVWSRVNPEAALPPALAAAVRSRLERAEAIARDALEVHYADLLALSAALEAEGHLSGNRVAVMLAGIPRPAA